MSGKRATRAREARHTCALDKAVKARTRSITGRAVSSLIKSQRVGDLNELYVFAKRNNIDYNVADPGDFPDTSTQAFDPVYMTKPYDVGFNLAKAGKKTPPQFGQ